MLAYNLTLVSVLESQLFGRFFDAMLDWSQGCWLIDKE